MSRSIAAAAAPPSAPGRRREIPLILGILLGELGLLATTIVAASALPALAIALLTAYFVLAFRRPNVAWALVWIAFPFSTEMLFPGGFALHVPTEPMILLFLAAWGIRVLLGEPLRLSRSPVSLALAALGLTALASALLGALPLVGLKAWLAAAAYVAFGYVYCFEHWDGPERVGRIVPWIVGFAAFWGIYGTVHVVEAGISLRVAYGAGRPFFPEHGAYAAYLAMILPMALLYTLERRGLRRILYGAASVAITLGVLLSLTRATWVSLAIVLPAMLLLWARWRRSWRPLGLALGLAAAIAVALPLTRSEERVGRHVESIGQSTDVSNLERFNRWLAAIGMVRDHPLLGVGLDAYPDQYPLYRRKIFLTDLAYNRMGAHSEPFRAAAEMGLIGLAAGLWFLVASSLAGIRAFRTSSDPRVKVIALAVVAGIGTWWVHALFRTYFDLEKVAVPFWAGLGVLAAALRSVEHSRAERA